MPILNKVNSIKMICMIFDKKITTNSILKLIFPSMTTTITIVLCFQLTVDSLSFVEFNVLGEPLILNVQKIKFYICWYADFVKTTKSDVYKNATFLQSM